MKRTPLKRGTSQLKRTRLNTTSWKRKKANNERAKVLEDLRKRMPWCAAQIIRRCTNEPQDGHEILTRGRGGSITDRANILMVCRLCHNWITEHPKEATCRGFIVPSWVGEEGLPLAEAVRQLRELGQENHPPWCGCE